MRIILSEQPVTVPNGTTLFALKDARKPAADIVVLNGAVVSADRALAEGDSVNLIQRGEIPSKAELEALLMARHTPGVHQTVKAATVGVAGLGGLGSTIAIALVRTGVGKLILADFDVIEPTNLNRQQYSVDQLGMYKAEALRVNLERINPYVTLETHILRLDDGNIGHVFAGVDVMVEAFDSADAKAMLLRSFPKAHPETPVVSASGLAGHGPSNTIRTRRIIRNLYLVGDEDTQAEPGMGLMAPRVGIAASHQANAVLRLLLGEDPAAEE